MLRPVGLGDAHMECRELRETIPVLTEILAFEKVAEAPGQATLKHPNTEWRLVVHEGGPDAPEKQMPNHFGVRVGAAQEVDAAFRYLCDNREKYGLSQIGSPSYSHGSYSLYFLEPGTNGWEIECYETVLRKKSGWTRLGGVRAPHWSRPYSAERFAGRGYVPQGFTHGTLACGNLKVSWNFYANILGLEVHQANDHVIYVKHPATKPYIVCAVRKEWKTCSPNFRFEVALESRKAVKNAYQELSDSREKLGINELGELQEKGPASSFWLRDPDGNCWEIASPEMSP